MCVCGGESREWLKIRTSWEIIEILGRGLAAGAERRAGCTALVKLISGGMPAGVVVCKASGAREVCWQVTQEKACIVTATGNVN